MPEQMHRVTAKGFFGEAPIWLYRGYEICRDGARSWAIYEPNNPNAIAQTFSRRACGEYIDRLNEWTMEEWVEFWAGFYEADEG